MTDTFTKEERSKIMRAVKSKKTSLESKVTKELWKHGLRFRVNIHDLLGKPDIAIKKYKIVIFIDSCFFHGCSLHCRIPKSNEEYWVTKIRRNIERDLSVNRYYNSIGWNVMRVWEHDLKEDFLGTVQKLIQFVNLAKRQ
ncbi:Very-short-patch mismatch repair endonuclease (G-T specific) [Paenibacillus pasadenensis]|uniref:Very short patch repair endonuclease n=1 Tax=Paenibacillus pasadenensis TaxID=217090 RepID=A0A2N5N0E2_9BACL|nr:very short patch repair endonuclease [Paenibacillus pasadenensis]PLT43795.1 Very-short-patch mismatch repair endonuclease (G-T specific) [Paenibacillus pasadenensis]